MFRARVWLASAMWVPVLAANAVAVTLGIGLPLLDSAIGDRPALPIPLSVVEQIMGALAAGMITFTGIVFSAVFVVAQIQTSSYSPRIAARLRRDHVIIAGLALPTATASYSLFALAAIGREADRTGENVAPSLTVGVALLLALITIGTFVALVQRAFDSTQIGGILRGLMRRAHHVIENVHPEGDYHRSVRRDRQPGERAVEVHYDGPPAVLAAVDRAALLRLARQTGGFVEVVPAIGHYIPPGAVTLRLLGVEDEPRGRDPRQVLVLARQRTMDQDPAFAMRMFVDIAIRGLSPAVNDPTTAVQSLDRIETLLVELHGRLPSTGLVLETDGTARGSIPVPTWREYFDLALIEIRHYGAGSAQVARRLRALYAHLLDVVDESERGRVELEQRLLDEQLAARFPDPEEREILSRSDRLGLGGAS
jgi:uncharacterized membrane protein